MNYKMQFGAVEMAGSDLGTSAGNIDTKLSEMEEALKPLQADWTGEASEAYLRAKAQWNSALAEMKQILQEMGRQVMEDAANGQASERKNQSRW
ncbi:WXG100 family type VII secretion target [Microbacterium halotolerans]|uniref:WXG100 family type VII secretion target n=1 Tax=Microbacterium halotolerans TaxID=246613 RepID=UPI000E6AB235|nr:WXG100 family type VII secretion target [Microbacterium halotolerans]